MKHLSKIQKFITMPLRKLVKQFSYEKHRSNFFLNL
jgi:hypothetical protein